MGSNELEKTIFDDIEPIIRGLGYELVELRAAKLKTSLQAFVVIYRKEGIGLDACSDVLKTIRPRLQMLADQQDVHLEVSSPGTDRVLKSRREYALFLGRGLKVLAAGYPDWVGGIMEKVDDKGLHLVENGITHSIPFEDIRKAKLDYSQEVG